MDQTEQKSTLRNVTQPTVQQRPCQAKHAGCGDEKRLRGANRPDVALLPGFEGIKLRCLSESVHVTSQTKGSEGMFTANTQSPQAHRDCHVTRS